MTFFLRFNPQCFSFPHISHGICPKFWKQPWKPPRIWSTVRSRAVSVLHAPKLLYLTCRWRWRRHHPSSPAGEQTTPSSLRSVSSRAIRGHSSVLWAASATTSITPADQIRYRFHPPNSFFSQLAGYSAIYGSWMCRIWRGHRVTFLTRSVQPVRCVSQRAESSEKRREKKKETIKWSLCHVHHRVQQDSPRISLLLRLLKLLLGGKWHPHY